MELIIIVLIVLCGVGVVKVLGNIMRIMNDMAIQELMKKDCPPHKWMYIMVDPSRSDISYMVCSKCNFRAGSGGNE